MRTMQERFVAFIDILGFRDIVNRMTTTEPALFNIVREILESILKEEQSTKGPIGRLLDPDSQLEMTAFSDCVVISDIISNFLSVALRVHKLNVELLERGLYCRGAIVRGTVYHVDRIVFGPAVIEAYSIESCVAYYPRILVDDEIPGMLSEVDRKAKAGIRYAEMVARDLDGCWYIDPFALPRLWVGLKDNQPIESAEYNYYNRVRSVISHDLGRLMREERKDSRRLAKIRWLANHFNEAIKRKGLSSIEPINPDKQNLA